MTTKTTKKLIIGSIVALGTFIESSHGMDSFPMDDCVTGPSCERYVEDFWKSMSKSSKVPSMVNFQELGGYGHELIDPNIPLYHVDERGKSSSRFNLCYPGVSKCGKWSYANFTSQTLTLQLVGTCPEKRHSFQLRYDMHLSELNRTDENSGLYQSIRNELKNPPISCQELDFSYEGYSFKTQPNRPPISLESLKISFNANERNKMYRCVDDLGVRLNFNKELRENLKNKFPNNSHLING